MKTRKIIQIQLDSHPECSSWKAFQEMYALCDDGTVWLNRRAALPAAEVKVSETPWIKLPDIPQDTLTPETISADPISCAELAKKIHMMIQSPDADWLVADTATLLEAELRRPNRS